MQFLHPGFLWGLLALAIPIIIHLFHFRRYKKVYFTNVRFLKELKDERNARRKLRNLLVLVMRLLAVAALVFAFAQPYIANKERNVERKLISVFVDNSYSMNALSQDVPLIDKAKRKAEQIIKAYSETDRFQLLSHDYSGVTSRILTREEALEQLENIEITASIKDIDVIVQRMSQSFKDMRGEKRGYILSDFQKNITDLPSDVDTTLDIQFLPFQSVQNSNISIDTAYLISPTPLLNQPNPLIVTLTNRGNEDVDNIRINVLQNGQSKPSGNVDIQAGKTTVDTIALSFTEAGNHDISLEVNDYPIQFDDVYNLNAYIDEDGKILNIYSGGSNRYLQALFNGVPEMKLDQAISSNVNYNEFDQYSLIILDDLNQISSGLINQLSDYVSKGGNVVVFPSKNGGKESYNQLLGRLGCNPIKQWEDSPREVLNINTDEFVFSKVFAKLSKNISLPTTKGNYSFSTFAANGAESILRYRDGSPFVSKYKKSQGQVFVCASPLDRTINPLVENAEIFVPMIYKMSLSQGAQQMNAFTLGQTNSFTIKNPANQNEILYEVSGDDVFIPQQTDQGNVTQITIGEEVADAGFYDVLLDDTPVKRLAFNFNRKESVMDFFSVDELKDNFSGRASIIDVSNDENLARIIKEKEEGIFLWRLFLIIALVFLALETLILRFWKE